MKLFIFIILNIYNRYINEFVNHYQKLGYDHIYIYDNNNKNDERMDQIYFNSNFVTIIDYRGYNNKDSQYKAYYNCYKNYNKKGDWLSFFDFDEFLEIF